ncbi:MAG: acyl carrier protein [Clostridiaceae bacterium]|nr:acyl carrier protein [Clostridiaceae bacterium]
MTDKTGSGNYDIRGIVYNAVAEAAGSDLDELSDTTELITTLNMDSLAIFELAIELEEAFKLRIPDEDIDEIKTIGDVISYIENKVV